MWNDMLAEVIGETLTGFRQELAAFGPRLLAMTLILLSGIVIAGALRVALRFVLRRVGLDALAERLGITEALARVGFSGRASSALAALAATFALAFFVVLALGTLDLQFARELVSQAFSYLPQVIVAGALLALGSVVAGFVRRGVLIAAVNAGMSSGRLLAGVTHAALLVLFGAMALEHLGLGRQVVLITYTILFGGVVLALALSFGLAGRDVARELLERATRRGEPPREDPLRHL
jgi:hypothetical protein